jgi:nitric oxide reductase activation protein
MLMARESREEQDRRSERMQNLNSVESLLDAATTITVGHKSSISTHIVLGAATVCMAVLGSFA